MADAGGAASGAIVSFTGGTVTGAALVAAAAAYATWCHRRQRRKQSGLPYIFHPARVAALLWRCGHRDAHLLTAAWLHDVVEDTAGAVKAPPWPQAVVRLVSAATERKRWPDGAPVPWMVRKHRLLAEAGWDPAVAALKAADLADNLSDIARYGWVGISVGPIQYGFYATGLLRLVNGKLKMELLAACEMAGVRVANDARRVT